MIGNMYIDNDSISDGMIRSWVKKTGNLESLDNINFETSE